MDDKLERLRRIRELKRRSALTRANQQDATVSQSRAVYARAQAVLGRCIEGQASEAQRLSEVMSGTRATVRELQYAGQNGAALQRLIIRASQNASQASEQLRHEQARLDELRRHFWRAEANTRKIDKLDERVAQRLGKQEEFRAELALDAAALRARAGAAALLEDDAGDDAGTGATASLGLPE